MNYREMLNCCMKVIHLGTIQIEYKPARTSHGLCTDLGYRGDYENF